MEVTQVALDRLTTYPGNPRRGDIDLIASSLQRRGQYRPIVVAADDVILAGNHTYLAARRLGWDSIAAVHVPHLHDTQQAREIVLVDNRAADAGEYDDRALLELIDSLADPLDAVLGYDDDDLADLRSLFADEDEPGEEGEDGGGAPPTPEIVPLVDRFGWPPFTVLRTMDQRWVLRRQAWKALGMRSEVGRGEQLVFTNVVGEYENFYRSKELAQQEAGRALTNIEVVEQYGHLLKPISGTSIFDPVLAELSYRWFCPPAGTVLDPWAGGSVRGIVAAATGHAYTGVELRDEQVRANRAQVPGIHARVQALAGPVLTPVERRGEYWLKRDDLYTVAGACGGKARATWLLASAHAAAGAPGVVAVGARTSTQPVRAARIAAALGVPCRVHTSSGAVTAQLQAAVDAGATLAQHEAGYMNVVRARADEDARLTGWGLLPYGAECQEAVTATAAQVVSLTDPSVQPARIVIPVGSGTTAAGVLRGLATQGIDTPVLGVQVGGDPTTVLDRYCPGWRGRMTLVKASVEYATEVHADLEGVPLDPIYEAKCAEYLQPGDLLWVVGHRDADMTGVPVAGEAVTGEAGALGVDPGDWVDPEWITGESTAVLEGLDREWDMILGCPPYYDLEVYSDDPADLSNLTEEEFDAAMLRNVAAAAARLRPDGYAVFVIGSSRRKDGSVRDMKGLMISVCRAAGLKLLNDAVLANSTVSSGLRARRPFLASRIMTRVHQEVLVFLKGDRHAAAARMGDREDDVALAEAGAAPIDDSAAPDTVIE